MTKIKKAKNKIEALLHSDGGQRFFNIAYSVGAAIVIWGALFKILHLEGGNTLLCIGMGTEIAMFLLTAFDRPPKEPNWEEIEQALTGKKPEEVDNLTIVDDSGNPESPDFSGDFQNGDGALAGGLPSAGGTVVLGSNSVALAGELNQATDELSNVASLTEATTRFVDAIEGISKQMGELHETLASGSEGYAEHIKDLNRNLAGLNTIYEIQLKSISGQLDAIDRVNKGLKEIRDMYEKSAADSARYSEETEKMTQYMQQINAMYARMISAMSIQMPVAAPQPTQPVNNTEHVGTHQS